MATTTIMKYEIGLNHTILRLPKGATILSTDYRASRLVILAIVDPAQPLNDRQFEVYGIGFALPEEIRNGRYYSFIGSAHIDNNFVCNVFERFQQC